MDCGAYGGQSAERERRRSSRAGPEVVGGRREGEDGGVGMRRTTGGLSAQGNARGVAQSKPNLSWSPSHGPALGGP